MVRPGGVIVHVGLLPGHEGLDIRKITLQEITFTGTYCYTPTDFRETVAALRTPPPRRPRLVRGASPRGGRRAFAAIDAGTPAAAKIILRP